MPRHSAAAPKLDAATIRALERAAARVRPCTGPGDGLRGKCDRKAGVPGGSNELCPGHFKARSRHPDEPLRPLEARRKAGEP